MSSEHTKDLSSGSIQYGSYTGARWELLNFFTFEGKRVLDVGSGGGGMAPLLRNAGALRIVGIECDETRAALGTGYDEMIVGTIEEALWTSSLNDQQFDLMLFADVLEHLADPWTTLRQLVRSNLAPDGQVFVSIPNVASMAVLGQLLLRRDWRYDDSGMFDRTHLRWFGNSTLRDLLRSAGLRPVTWGGLVKVPVGKHEYTRLMADVRHIPKLAIFQFHVLAERL